MLQALRLIAFRAHKAVISAQIVFLFGCVSTSLKANEDIDIRIVNPDIGSDLFLQIGTLLKQSNILGVAYVPYANVGSRMLDKKDLFKAWRYKFYYRCLGFCGDLEVNFESFFSSSILLAEECPKPYTVAFSFFKDEQELETVFVNNSGKCFTVGSDGASYYSESGNFYNFLSKEELYPAFSFLDRGAP